MRLSVVQRRLVIDVVQRDVPQAAQLETEVGRIGHRERDDQSLVGAQLEMPDRGILGGQTTGRQTRRDHGVDRDVQIKPLRELKPGLDSVDQLLSRCAVTLFDRCAAQGRRCRAGGIRPRDRQRAALRRPVAVDLTNHQLSGTSGANLPLEAAVRGDLELTVVERGLAGGYVVVGVLAAEQLEAQVCRRAANAGDDIVVVGLHPAAEIQGVRIVQSHFGERPGSGEQHRVVAVVIEHHVRAGSHTTGEILQPFQQVRFGLDMRCGGDQLLGLDDGSDKRLGK